ncbi:DNA repair-scaffolding protein isoform X1 [Peromyscus californicus insignis]|uniref:DNA repair-scaffolding protein isoform X1 n=1 Tax=Peromyscus californicus insignis TaxID=564181 RepID=UPI0022A79C25|nr:DNA repair-scaffolding protein isoform X1 [Peromyscus californicus insignis]
MSGSGRAGASKRKRNWRVEHPSFLEERPQQSRRANLKTVEAAASLSKAWLKCGEGFQDTSETLSLASEKTAITGKSLELSSSPKKAETAGESPSEVADITWSSSGSDFSDEDKTLPQLQRDGRGYVADRFCSRMISCPEDGATEDELQFIDWEINSDMEDPGGPSECDDGEGAVDISDCASCASSHSLTNDDRLCEPPEPISTEIVEYSSDSDKEDDLENALFIDSESPHKYQMDFKSDARQSLNRQTDSGANSTEPVLSTPQKYTANFPKTPENSATKKKLLRGGLAERLKELQNRERSAISLWRHRCVSYQITSLGRKSGVLTVKILELHEECTMQVAVCKQLAGPPASPPRGIAPRLGACLKVLFTRETADHLRGHPQDIIYIFPPWQKLLIPNGTCSIILNTYFCQKAIAKETMHEVYCQDTSHPRRNITLAQMFRIEDITSSSSRSQITCSGLTTTGTGWTHGHDKAELHLAVGAPLKDSLLDIVESQRAGPWSGVGVRVVVQRVYSLLSGDGARSQQGHTVGHEDSPGAWSCLLVQDACGMFGEVYLDGTLWKNIQLEGRSCCMAGMRAVQKTTRGRTPGLFSLIDTMWPPVMPLAEPSCGEPSEEMKTCLPPPTFCYIFSVHPSLGHVDAIEGDPISELYRPPVVHCLREILQTDGHGTRCSFYGRVIYQRPQLKNLLAQKEIWLLVTDITLQIQDERDHYLPKTLPIYVTPSCVLGPEVLEGLTMAVPHNILFRDALRDKGQIVCVERTVLLPQKSLLYVPSGASSCDLPGPVILDELGSLTPVNSICSVQGAVVDIDESTAFSWPVCDRCGNGRLEQKPEDGGSFSCGDCLQLVVSPLQKRQLHVFLDCPTRPKSTVKVKLLESSISSLLVSAASKDGSYEVKNVLGKEMGPLLCFVQSATPQQTSCVTLEEIELLGAGGGDHPSS